MNKIYTCIDINELDGCIPHSSSVFVIIDNNLKQFYDKFSKYNVISVEVNETKKTLESVAEISQRLLEMGADRDAFILGVGGGIITDIVGFVASIYKRGVRFGFLPTTLLAQVDASIGGKNGVNFLGYKNILGVINQPEFIYICSSVLKTLPPKELKAGVAEVLKTFILFDREKYEVAVNYFTQLERKYVESGTYLDKDGKFMEESTLTELIGLCAKYKKGVVERDEFERGERRLLNLGHTFAHAVEKFCADEANLFPIMHGEAVSIGLVIAAKLAALLSPTDETKEFVIKIKNDLIQVGLPTQIPVHLNMTQLVEAVAKDKKVSGSNVHFILPFGLEKIEDRAISLNKLEKLADDLC